MMDTLRSVFGWRKLLRNINKNIDDEVESQKVEAIGVFGNKVQPLLTLATIKTEDRSNNNDTSPLVEIHNLSGVKDGTQKKPSAGGRSNTQDTRDGTVKDNVEGDGGGGKYAGKTKLTPDRVSTGHQPSKGLSISGSLGGNRPKKRKKAKEIMAGLEAFSGITDIHLETSVNVEQLAHWELNRHYSLTDQSGKKIYHCGENARWVYDVLCQGCRPFLFLLFDPTGEVVVEMQQKCSCMLCLFHGECAGAKVSITVAKKTLGTVSQIYTCCTPSYEVLDPEDNRIMTIIGKCCRVCVRCPSRPFLVFADVQREEGGEVSTEVVAYIDRNHVGFKRENTEMHVEMKCLLLGALFLIEMNYFRSCRGVSKVIIIVMIIIVIAGLIRVNSPSMFDKNLNKGGTASSSSPVRTTPRV